ncbi:MAG: hypothetical protein H6713_28100 [Myxococcales bacterium]|nr:hypothetical protein [Myxococcales bacterium]
MECGTVKVECGVMDELWSAPVESCRDEGTPFTIRTPSSLECALTALRDGTPMFVEWESNPVDQYKDSGYLLLFNDGRALQRRWYSHDLCGGVDEAELAMTRDPVTFETCLESTEPRARFFCLLDALGEPTLETCGEMTSYCGATRCPPMCSRGR